MPVTTDILRTWRRPRAVLREHFALGVREDRALIFLMVGCLVMCVGQWPRLAREAHLQSEPLDQLIASAVYGWLFFVPLALYLVAGVVALLARAIGAPVSGYGVRLALFWGLLAASPGALLYGLTVGMTGPGPGAQLAGAVWLVALAVFWVQGLREAGARAA